MAVKDAEECTVRVVVEVDGAEAGVLVRLGGRLGVVTSLAEEEEEEEEGVTEAIGETRGRAGETTIIPMM